MGQPQDPTGVKERYRVVVHGEFGDLLAAAFGDVSLTSGDGKTVLVAAVRDSQELYGILDRLRDHGVHIVEVTQMDEPHESEQER